MDDLPSGAASSNLEPFFVLHKASSTPKQESKSERPKKTKTKRKINLSPSSGFIEATGNVLECSGDMDSARLEAFESTWSKIEMTVNDVLLHVNLNLYEEVNSWVQESFSAFHSTCSVDAMCMRIPTSLILTRNAEFVDDMLTFHELGKFLRSKACHVANLSAQDFLTKHGIGLCIRSLLRMLVPEVRDATDTDVLLSWYMDGNNRNKPVVIIIDDMERCCGEVLSELISILSECINNIPIILIMGIATTVDSLRRILPLGVLQYLQPRKFMLVTPYQRMNLLVEDVFVKLCSGFTIGHQVATFLRSYFLRHDGTITSMIRALKLACIKHFSMEPLAVWSQCAFNDSSETDYHHIRGSLEPCSLKHASDHHSCWREASNGTGKGLEKKMLELKRLWKTWSAIVMCLFEGGKLGKVEILDVLCEAMDPSSLTTTVSLHNTTSEDRSPAKAKFCPVENGFISQTIHNIRELSQESLFQLLDSWRTHTREVIEIRDKIEELISMVPPRDSDKGLKVKGDTSKAEALSCKKSLSFLTDKAALLLEDMVRNFLVPLECVPCHEIICFKNIDVLQSALLGDARRTIQADLLNSQSHLQCGCCGRHKDDALQPSLHDTSIMYNLAQEHGDLINLHDWYQSFKATVLETRPKRKRKMQNSPSSKTAKKATAAAQSEANIQARFCRAVTELQIVGLLRMPSKRKRDFVQRVAFGL